MQVVRDDIIEGQALGDEAARAVLAGKPVAQENVELGKGWAARHGDVGFKHDHAGQAQRDARRVDLLIIFREGLHAVEKDCLDRVLSRAESSSAGGSRR
jgi:hypothetical protein